MIKTLLLITICLFTGFAVAKPVSQSAATRVANQFWQSVLHGQGQLRPTPWQYSEIYLFVGDQGGFVMVSADDCARPVIAYSLHGSLSLRALPVQLSQRMEAYCGLIAEGKNQQVSATTSDAFQWEQLTNGILPKEGENDDRVGPLLETHWHQDGGYALLTPQHTPTGCAATAQAQMMRYWRYPAFGHGNESYNCQPYGAQSADFSHTLYDWNNMPDQVSPASPYEQQLAVSTLMYHVGVSLHMGYAPGGSAAAGVVGRPGVPSIDNSLKDHFYYNHSMRPIFKTDGYTDQRWADSLVAELRLQHPIVYCGVAPEGGHGFVCDGYEYRAGQVFFHFNFGWSGNGDGYYTVDDICPNVSPTGEIGSIYHFNQSNQALLGAVPDYGLHVSDTMLTFTRDGGNQQLLFCSIDTSALPWSVSNDQPWVTVDRNGVEHVGEGRAGGVAVGENRAVGVALGEVLSEAERRDVRKALAAAQLHVAGRAEVVEAPRAEPSEGFLRPGRLGRIVGLAEAPVRRMAERVAEGTARMDPAAAEHEARRAVRRDDAGAPVDVGDAEEAGGRHVGGIRGEGGMDRSERKRDDGGDSHVKRLLSGSCGRKAPSARRVETRRPGSSERGLAPAAQDRAAAVPAAWPMAMHGGMTRIAAAAQALALTHRPATSRFSAPRGTRQR